MSVLEYLVDEDFEALVHCWFVWDLEDVGEFVFQWVRPVGFDVGCAQHQFVFVPW